MIFTADSVVYGPFRFIEEMGDRLRCDGIDFPFTVIGAYQISEDDSQAPTPTPVVIAPKKVTRRQALAALLINGVTSAMIEATINAMPITDLQKELALNDFRESTEFQYDWPLVIQMCAAMNLDRDELFILADSL